MDEMTDEMIGAVALALDCLHITTADGSMVDKRDVAIAAIEAIEAMQAAAKICSDKHCCYLGQPKPHQCGCYGDY